MTPKLSTKHMYVFSLSSIVSFLVAAALLFPGQASAVDIQTVKSSKGVTALLVENYTVPLIALSFAFEGGSTQDMDGKEGTSKLLTTMMDEGAGDLKSQELQVALEDVGMTYSFSTGFDSFSGGIKTLKETADGSFELLRLMLTQPRFDEDPTERMKVSLTNRLKNQETQPGAIAAKKWSSAVFAGHPYSRPSGGKLETVSTLAREDLVDFHRRVFARDNLVIGVVGAISADELKAVLDKVFGDLPEKSGLKKISEAKPNIGDIIHVDLDVPQTNIRIALPGLKRDDPDFFTAYLVNYVVGGGSFSSRLYNEVREKRGLAYGVYSYLATYDHAGVVGGGSATRTERVEETVKVMVDEFARIAADGPTEAELEKAKKYIVGSYAIQNLDTSGKIASVLVAIQQADLGLDYIDKRANYINSVTIADAKRVAARLFSQKPTVVTVGRKGS